MTRQYMPDGTLRDPNAPNAAPVRVKILYRGQRLTKIHLITRCFVDGCYREAGAELWTSSRNVDNGWSGK